MESRPLHRKPGGAFVISLDFELYWGLRHSYTLPQCRDRLLGARQAIPAMLDLFSKYEVAATWATVGLLFFDEKEEMLLHLPETKPVYANPRLSPYDGFADVGRNEKEDPCHFALSLIRRIEATPRQELGSHTFSHLFALEKGVTREAFAGDLAAARRAAERIGVRMRSLVPPWNQLNLDYAPVLQDEGFDVVRGNPDSWLYSASSRAEDTPARRAGRLADSCLPLSGRVPTRRRDLDDGLTDVPATLFLRPITPRLRPLAPFKAGRIRTAMTHAARSGGIFHLWWHPHNFGVATAENLAFLEGILRHYRRLADEQGMVSRSMAEAAQDLPAERTGRTAHAATS